MSVNRIVEYPESVLREECQTVTAFDTSLETLVSDLLDTLYAGNAVALSAPQIGDKRRVFTIDVSRERNQPSVYINPELSAGSHPGFVQESCMSLPGIKGNVWRSTQIAIAAFDTVGKPFEERVSKLHAVCAQHELDHLNGVLFIDRLTALGKWRLKLSPAAKRILNRPLVRPLVESPGTARANVHT